MSDQQVTNLFRPGQPIGMGTHQFTQDMQKQIIDSKFNPGVPTLYDSLANNILTEQNPNPQPEMVTISKEEYARLSQPKPIESVNVNERINAMFPQQPTTPPPVTEQNPGNTYVPPTQSNETSELSRRLFGDPTPDPNTQQNDQQLNVNTNPNDMNVLREELARVCGSRGIDPQEYVQFAASITSDDIADLFVAVKQQQASGAQSQQQQVQQPIIPQQPAQPGAPINLAEVNPNPQSFPTGTQNNNYWK